MTSYLPCPFCMNSDVIAKPGKHKCLDCGSRFEIDDRLECIFVDPDNIKLPAKGTICPSCGLVQGDETKTCPNCRTEINTAAH